MADIETGSKPPSVGKASTPPHAQDDVSLHSSDNLSAILPEGQIDPVYEKKAKLLNRAVSPPFDPHPRTFKPSTPPNNTANVPPPLRSKTSAWAGTNGSSAR